MSIKFFLGLLTVILLIFTLVQLSRCETQASTLPEWQVDNGGGFYSESNGVIRLWSNGGSDGPYNGGPYIGLYKQIKPTSDFTFSVQVNAKIMESCAVNLRSSLPTGGKQAGITFEFGAYGEGLFLLARNTSNSMFNQLPFEGSSLWTVSQIANGDPNVWYSMQLNVSSSPFVITASVLAENGTLLGSFSISDMSNFTFEDINYIGLHVWGYSPSDYLFRNIQDSFDNQASITISTNCSSAAAGSAINVYGTLSDSNSLTLQNKTVVLSYTFQGINSWIPISSGLTDELGNYNIQWVNSASGTFTLKAEWCGDSTNMGASNITTLSFLPSQDQRVFIFESNSTVTALAFNNDTSTLSFNVTGQSGTTGFVRATIAKSMLANGENLQVYMDGQQLQYSVTSTVDSWMYCFNYSHSTHQISIHLASSEPAVQPVGNELMLIAIIALFGVIIGSIVYSFSRKSSGKPTD